ncbi:hypothetical protein ACFQ3Z_20570 [Streptomyces nogalater]
MRSAVQTPSLSAKYERHVAGDTFSLRDLPVLTHQELTAATQEALALYSDGDSGCSGRTEERWRHPASASCRKGCSPPRSSPAGIRWPPGRPGQPAPAW